MTIRVSHAGSLPRTDKLITANAARFDDNIDKDEFGQLLTDSVVDIVKRQKDVGITEVNDGEYGHAMAAEKDYGAWWHYSFERTSGLELQDVHFLNAPPVRSEPGKVVLTSFPDRRDRHLFPGVYGEAEASGADTGVQPQFPVAVEPVRYIGQELIQRDIQNLKKACEAAGIDPSTAYINSLGPSSAARIENGCYDSDEEFIWAMADVFREEYLAIAEAGFIIQIDDPSIAENWDQINPAPTFEEYRKFTRPRIEALNYALRGIDPQQVRFHTCWGSWHGPHVTDLPFEEIVDDVLSINAAGITFEAANVRHEHEWRIWEDTKLPDGKYIIPGIVSHSTNIVEHPQLVADRIERFARLVGPENVVASTDCGLGGRVHPEIAWAKLESLAQGAEIASKRLGS